MHNVIEQDELHNMCMEEQNWCVDSQFSGDM